MYAIILAIAIFSVVGIYGVHPIRYGLSAPDTPSSLEAVLVRRSRRWTIPASAKNLTNPMPATPEMLERGGNHWADHCATCHANNGSGERRWERISTPKPPDMRQLQTQSLTEGELYNIIRNGVRMSGMPAWGKPKD
jgi:hypothetical protein